MSAPPVASARSVGPSARRFVLGLGLSTLVMVLFLSMIVVAVWRQSQSFEENARLRTDSVTALTFQLEREFLRLQAALDHAVLSTETIDRDALALRLDLFISRVNLLADNPTTAALAARDPYKAVMPRLQVLMDRSDAVLQPPQPERAALSELLREYQTLAPEVLALSLDANSLMTTTLEEQVRTVQRQNQQVMALLAALLVMGLLAFVLVVRRSLSEDRQRAALMRLTDEREHALQVAEEASRSKSRFLANMSHELRTPFNGMLGMLTLLESTSLDERQRDCLDTARSSAQHLLALLNDILDMSALEAGRLTLKPQGCSLRELMREVEALMRVQAQGKQLQLEMKLSADLPDSIIADGTRLKQVLFNLIGNAIKFTEQGLVQVTVQTAGPSPNVLSTPVRFTVRDSGIGMDDATLSRLFRRFEQADNTASRRFGGTGLGLEISRTLARMMGGDITATSQRGQGSQFVFDVPLALNRELPAVLAPSASSGPSAGSSRSLQVLVAEDHPVNQKLVKLLLEKLGHAVTLCDNGEIAVQALRAQSYDVVLMDIHMPVMDGLEATRAIRQLPEPLRSVPIVALTADVMSGAQERAMAAGMNCFLTKPVKPSDLQATLQAVARQMAAEAEPAQA